MGTQKTYQNRRKDRKGNRARQNQSGAAYFLLSITVVVVGSGFLYLAIGSRSTSMEDSVRPSAESEMSGRRDDESSKDSERTAAEERPAATQAITTKSMGYLEIRKCTSTSQSVIQPSLEAEEVNSFSKDLHKTFEAHFEIRHGSFSIPSKMSRHDDSTVYWWRTDTPSPHSNDVIYYAPFPNENMAEGGMAAAKVCAMYGFTVFSIPFNPGTKINEDIDFDDKKFYIYKESGYYDDILTARGRLLSELKLPDRPMYVAGFSGGGIIAQRLAEYYPSIVAGVASYGGRRFAIYRKAKCPFLFVINVDDVSEKAVIGIEEIYKTNGNIVVDARSTGEWGMFGDMNSLFTHHPRYEDQTLLATWIAGISEMNNNGSDAANSTTTKFPYRVYFRHGSPWPPVVIDKRKVCTELLRSSSSELYQDFPSRESVASYLALAPAAFDFPDLSLRGPDVAKATVPHGLTPFPSVTPPSCLNTALGICLISYPHLQIRENGNYNISCDVIDAKWDARYLADSNLVTVIAGYSDGPACVTSEYVKFKLAQLARIVPEWSSLPLTVILVDPDHDALEEIAKTSAIRCGILLHSDRHGDVMHEIERQDIGSSNRFRVILEAKRAGESHTDVECENFELSRARTHMHALEKLKTWVLSNILGQ